MDPISTIVSLVVTAVVNAGVSAATRAISGKQKSVSRPKRQTIATRKAAVDVGGPRAVDSPLSQSADPGGPQIGLFGRRRVGGRVVLSAKSGTSTHLAVVILGAPSIVNAIYINNALIARSGTTVTTAPWTGSTMTIALYQGTQTAVDSVLDAAFAGWTPAMIGTGQTYARITITPGTNTAYDSGVPDFTFDVDGFPVYDPRDPDQLIGTPSTWQASSNPALIAAAYLTHELGRHLPTTSIDWVSVAAAADICDQQVDLASGLTENRYSCSAYWLTNESHESVLERIAAAMAGRVYFLGDKYRVDAGVFADTGVPVITPDDYVGDGLAWADTPPIDQLANGVRGRFASPTNNFELRDFPAYQDAAAVAADGGEYWLDVDFEFVTSAAQAQRLARIAYHKTRRAYAATVDVRFKWFDTCRGDVIRVNDPLAGIDAAFRVEGDDVDPEFGVNFELAYEDAAMWAWTAATDEMPMPAPVSLTSAGGVGVNPDDAGPLQPPGAIFTGSRVAGSQADRWNYNVTATFAASPSARVTQLQFQIGITSSGYWAPETLKTVAVGTGSTSHTFVNILAPQSLDRAFRVRALAANGEVSAWNTLASNQSLDEMRVSPNTSVSTSVAFVLPAAAAMRIQSQGTGSAVLQYFAAAGSRSNQIWIYRNTTNAPGGTLVATNANANGTITETQPAGSTRYYFARVVNTATGQLGPWSNALLVAF